MGTLSDWCNQFGWRTDNGRRTKVITTIEVPVGVTFALSLKSNVMLLFVKWQVCELEHKRVYEVHLKLMRTTLSLGV